MYSEIVGEIEVETIAVGGRIRDNIRLRKRHGEDGGANSTASLRFDCKVVNFVEPSYVGTRPMVTAREK